MANINQNRINTTVSPADLATVNTALQTIATTLQPYTMGLTDEERASLPGLAQENYVFAQDALAQAQFLSSELPPAIQAVVGTLQTDLSLFDQMRNLEDTFVSQLAGRLGDTKRLAGYEAYNGALAVYKVIEAMANLGIPGANEAYDVLKERFVGQGGRPVVPNP